MSRAVAAASLSCVLLAGAATAAAPATSPSELFCTPVATGTVTLARQEALPDFLNAHLDQAVVLRLSVDAATPAEEDAGFLIAAEDGQLIVGFSSDLGEGGWEALVDAGGYQTRPEGWMIDGVFTVRSGGVHQGIVSYALERQKSAAKPVCPIAQGL